MNYDRILKFNRLLKIAAIKHEFDTFTQGCTASDVELVGRSWLCSLNKEGERNTLSLEPHSFTLTKTTDNILHRLVAHENLTIQGDIVERRDNGVIYTVYVKCFSDSKKHNGIVLSDYYEERYVFTSDSLDKLNDWNMTNTSMLQIVLILLKRNSKKLKQASDYYSTFESRMSTYLKNPLGGRLFKNTIHPTTTLVNGEDVSYLFDSDSPNKIYEIIELYNGIISPLNERNINEIHREFSSTDCFGLKELKGITALEDELVGKSKIIPSEEYINYLKDYLYFSFGYQGQDFSRDGLIKAITHKMRGVEIAKWSVAKTLGIRYSEFEKMDYDEQQKLILECKQKKK